jgi:hypothetical protein
VLLTTYEPIRNEYFENIDDNDLSSDQKYLLHICKAISNGNMSPTLSQKKPGPLCHSRWITTASRILRLYASMEYPSESLKEMSYFVIHVYAVSWFSIKIRPLCIHGPKNFFLMIKNSRYLANSLREIIDKVLQRNAFFAHQENILLAMIFDSRANMKTLAYRRILAVREKRSNVRKFELPKLNFNANDYTDMIFWQEVDRCEPPIMQQYSSNDIRNLMNDKISPTLEIVQYPSNTQAVERAVKMVTEASQAVYGAQERDQLIKVRILSRSQREKFDTKSQYYNADI